MLKLHPPSTWHRIAVFPALLVFALVSTTALTALSSTSAHAAESAVSAPVTSELPSGKQTALGLYVTSREAFGKWQTAPDKVMVLDVRTPEEFLFIGHAEMAWNIPVAEQVYQWDAEKQHFPMMPLADFVTRVQLIANPNDTLLIMCRSGSRSAMAVNLLAKAGFTQVYNITDGMEGDKVEDPNSLFNGKRLVNGWKNSGLPWTYHVDPEQVVVSVDR